MLGFFLAANDSPLLAWDSSLAADLVTIGEGTGIDPRLIASILTLESGHGTHFGGNNNPFGLGPGNSYPNVQAALAAEANTLDKDIFTYGETSVTQLYSGQGNLVAPGKPWIWRQHAAYCVGRTAADKAACQKAGRSVADILSSQGGNTAAGLRSGNPNNLLYPCPE